MQPSLQCDQCCCISHGNLWPVWSLCLSWIALALSHFHMKQFAVQLILSSDAVKHSRPLHLCPWGRPQGMVRQWRSAGLSLWNFCEGVSRQELAGSEGWTHFPYLPPCSTFGRISEKLHVVTQVSALLHNSVIEVQTCFFSFFFLLNS